MNRSRKWCLCSGLREIIDPRIQDFAIIVEPLVGRLTNVGTFAITYVLCERFGAVGRSIGAATLSYITCWIRCPCDIRT